MYGINDTLPLSEFIISSTLLMVIILLRVTAIYAVCNDKKMLGAYFLYYKAVKRVLFHKKVNV